jgi:hypothetical protein
MSGTYRQALLFFGIHRKLPDLPEEVMSDVTIKIVRLLKFIFEIGWKNTIPFHGFNFVDHNFEGRSTEHGIPWLASGDIVLDGYSGGLEPQASTPSPIQGYS